MDPIEISKFEKIKSSGNLPSPKGVALALLRLSQRDDVAVGQLAQVVKADPAFTGRLIKAANGINSSPYRPIVSVHDALLILGLPAVRNLALGFSLLSQYAKGACRNFDYQRYWSGSLAFAIAAEAITLHTHAAPIEEVFSVGLLARVGELALATLFPTEYAEILGNSANAELTHLLRAERRAFAMNHQDLTTAMLDDWGIPRIFSEPLSFHENPDACTYPPGSRHYTLTHSLALARHIARICTARETDRPSLIPQLVVHGSRIGIEAEGLNALCDGVVRDWQEWGRTLNVLASPLPPFGELARAAPPSVEPESSDESGDTELRVLIVTADAATRLLLRRTLEQEGYEVHEAADGREAASAAFEIRPHMMIIGDRLPDTEGLALVGALRDTKLGRGLYLVALVDSNEEQKLVEAFEAGADDVMAGPLKPRLLATRLRVGQRVVRMQQEIERDRENMRHFASELAVTNRRLQEVAVTDALTGFPNRRYAMDRIEQEWQAALRDGRPLVCMVIDLDDFDQINDTYGHEVGDLYLKQSAAALRQGLRAQDVVCRTGGDRFMVVCPEADINGVLVCAERVRRTVESLPIRAGLLQLKATVSIGVAVQQTDMSNAEELVKLADKRVHAAKQHGKNRVVSA